MECTKCHRRLNISEFSYKNKKEKIYYLNCNDCRKKIKETQDKYKQMAKDNYELLKKCNNVNCECGISYTAFRSFHIYRHNNTLRHIEYIKSKNTNI
jgi:hypothetical protein